MRYWTLFDFSASFSDLKQLEAPKNKIDEIREKPTLIQAMI